MFVHKIDRTLAIIAGVILAVGGLGEVLGGGNPGPLLMGGAVLFVAWAAKDLHHWG